MDQGTLVESQVKDGARIVEKLRETGFDVAAAWWMKSTSEGLWFLYIASKEVEAKGIKGAYHIVNGVVNEMGDLWVDRFQVKLVEPEHRIAKDVLDLLAKSPGGRAIRNSVVRLGNTSVDGSYIYPQPVAA